MRKIVVDNETWEYMIGKNNVVLKNPRDEKKTILTLEKVTGRSAEAIRFGKENKTTDGMVTPSDLKKFIVQNYPPVEEEQS